MNQNDLKARYIYLDKTKTNYINENQKQKARLEEVRAELGRINTRIHELRSHIHSQENIICKLDAEAKTLKIFMEKDTWASTLEEVLKFKGM